MNDSHKADAGNSYGAVGRKVWIGVKLSAIAVGTVVIFTYLYNSLDLFFPEKPIQIHTRLDSGFVFTESFQDGRFDGHRLASEDGRTLVFSDVRGFTEFGDAIYGVRHDIRDNVVYFFCVYGTDCIDTQSLSESELNAITAARDLPPYGEPGLTRDRQQLARDARFNRSN